MVEREVKLGAASSFRQPGLSAIVEGVDAEAKPQLQLAATYFDTNDLRLTALGRQRALPQQRRPLAQGLEGAGRGSSAGLSS